MPQISVIVPVYNVEKYIHRCVDSILNQTFTDFELILVDDGSPDNCGAICDEYAAKDGRVVVMHQKNQGQAVARNNAVAIAKGKWICFVDGDDLIHPRMIELLWHGIETSGAEISVCGVAESEAIPEGFYDSPKAEYRCSKPSEAFFAQVYREQHYTAIACAKMMSKEIPKSIPFSAGRIYEDNAVVFQWLYRAKMIVDIKDPLYYYMVNPEGTTKSHVSIKHLDVLWANEQLIRFFADIGYEQMRAYKCSAYLANATTIYQRNQEESNDRIVKRAIRRKVFFFLSKNGRCLNGAKDQLEYTLSTLWPKLFAVFNYSRAVVLILYRHGITGLADKLKNYSWNKK